MKNQCSCDCVLCIRCEKADKPDELLMLLINSERLFPNSMKHFEYQAKQIRQWIERKFPTALTIVSSTEHFREVESIMDVLNKILESLGCDKEGA